MNDLKLFQVLIGATPKGRNIEQHDMFFGIANTIQEIVEQAKIFWPEAASCMHLDGYKAITNIDGYDVLIVDKKSKTTSDAQLFFINLGGYKPDEFEEYHYKIVIAAKNKSEAIKRAKATAFYKHIGFKGAESHIDDKYGIDVDDFYEINEILQQPLKQKYSIILKHNENPVMPDQLALGYFNLSKLMKQKTSK
jgi:hypothetical protein